MLLRIINDIEICLSAKAYSAALSLALMIPDICGRAEYENPRVGERYKRWYEEYIGKYEPYSMEGYDFDVANVTGEVLYELRCEMLHLGNPDVDKREIRRDRDKVDRFVIVYEEKTETGHSATSITTKDWVSETNGNGYRELTINLNTLCRKLCAVAKAYYENNKDKFDFFTYQFEPAIEHEPNESDPNYLRMMAEAIKESSNENS